MTGMAQCRGVCLALFFALVAGAASCGGSNPPPKRPAAPAKRAAPADPATAASTTTDASKSDADPLAPGTEGEPGEWTYSSTGKRDPFRTYLAEIDASAGMMVTRCSTPLGRYEIEQLKLVAVITGLADPVAMFEAPNGVGYTVRKGVCIGKNGGLVTAVRSGEVLITEMMMKADRTPEPTQTVIKLPQEAPLNLEE
jgi:type IV pilus assembly protein PilP